MLVSDLRQVLSQFCQFLVFCTDVYDLGNGRTHEMSICRERQRDSIRSNPFFKNRVQLFWKSGAENADLQNPIGIPKAK